MSAFINKKSGMNLVDIMLAVSILAFAILPVAGLLDYANRGTREQDAEGIAANLAKEEMNSLMYVIDQTNLLNGAPGTKNWSIKGNEFESEYAVFPHGNASLNFSVPQMNFHDPLGCAGGGEANNGVVGAPVDMNLNVLYPGRPPLLVDIAFNIRWRLPGKNFEPQNVINLIGRRAFLVEN